MHRQVLFLLLASAALHAEPSLSGSWMTATHKLDDGTDYHIYFQLKQEGATLTGRVIHPWGIIKVEGLVEGRRFTGSFRANVPRHGVVLLRVSN